MDPHSLIRDSEIQSLINFLKINSMLARPNLICDLYRVYICH